MNIDVELVKQARSGDKESFARVYDSVASDLYKVALYRLGVKQDAEDVVSETFIEAYKGIKNLRDENSFVAWIMRILSIRCKRRITTYIKDKTNADIDEFVNIPADDINVTVQSSDKVTVMEALDRLTQEEREIVVLATVQGYTTKEVSHLLNLPHGTVSSKLHRTLRKMRSMIE